MDGKKQTELMAELVKPWTPDSLAGFRVGDSVRLPNIECTFEVVGLNDPLLILRSPSGRELKAGWRAVQRVTQK